MSLRDIKIDRSIFFLPRDNFPIEVLIPCLRIAESFRCMFGFFSSESLSEMAAGLAEYLNRDTPRIELIISPHLSKEDQEALDRGLKTTPEVLEARLLELIGSASVSEFALVRHTLDCLAYLVSKDRITIKIALMKNAIFHPKVWILNESNDTLIAHGSVNMTRSGLRSNYEHVSIARSWIDENQRKLVEDFEVEFNLLWQKKHKEAVIVDLPEALRNRIIREYKPSMPPTTTDFLGALNTDIESGLVLKTPDEMEPESTLLESKGFHIPSWIRYDEGDFIHQGEAFRAWIRAGYNGILEMATGSGKTITALISAHELATDKSPLLIVIAVPYIPLVDQWADEVRRFGLVPIVPGGEHSRNRKLGKIEQVLRKIRLGVSRSECIIVTHDTLCDQEFQTLLASHDCHKLLIADEMHNLGRSAFISRPPEFPSFKLGLSATPVRQYDEEGTQQLSDYFGGIVYEFGLREAIGTCLVSYNYHIHIVRLTESELAEWQDLTAQLKRLGWMIENDNSPSEKINILLAKRRLVLERAETKLVKLESILKVININELHHTLVYATDKHPEQLEKVNELLRSLGIRFHQITALETSKARLTGHLIDQFRKGYLQVLTAKRVLDEGVNIPEIETAYILASTTVERQWIQRRGRILRKCSAIGKELATIHDFLVLPPENKIELDDDIRNLIKSELKRVLEFAKLAKNAASPGGPLEIIHPIYSFYFAGGEKLNVH